MAWLNVDINEIEKQVEQKDNYTGLIEPGVYEVTITDVYVDKTQSGAVFVNFEMMTKDGKEIKVTGWDVRRMVKTADGREKNQNGAFWNGILLLQELCKIKGIVVNDLTPKKVYKEIWGQNREVGQLTDLLNLKCCVGIRHRKTYYEKDGELKESIKPEIVKFFKCDDDIVREKVEKIIKNRPVLEDKKPETNNSNTQKTTDEEIPF